MALSAGTPTPEGYQGAGYPRPGGAVPPGAPRSASPLIAALPRGPLAIVAGAILVGVTGGLATATLGPLPPLLLLCGAVGVGWCCAIPAGGYSPRWER